MMIPHNNISRLSSVREKLLSTISELSNDSVLPFDTGNKDILDNSKTKSQEFEINSPSRSMDPKFMTAIDKRKTSNKNIQSSLRDRSQDIIVRPRLVSPVSRAILSLRNNCSSSNEKLDFRKTKQGERVRKGEKEGLSSKDNCEGVAPDDWNLRDQMKIERHSLTSKGVFKDSTLKKGVVLDVSIQNYNPIKAMSKKLTKKSNRRPRESVLKQGETQEAVGRVKGPTLYLIEDKGFSNIQTRRIENASQAINEITPSQNREASRTRNLKVDRISLKKPYEGLFQRMSSESNRIQNTQNRSKIATRIILKSPPPYRLKEKEGIANYLIGKTNSPLKVPRLRFERLSLKSDCFSIEEGNNQHQNFNRLYSVNNQPSKQFLESLDSSLNAIEKQ